MSDIWSSIGVVLGIIFVILLISSIKVGDERQNGEFLIQDYDQEDVLLDDLKEFVLIEEFEEELEDEEYFDDEV